MMNLSAEPKNLVGKKIMVNQSQLNKQQPNLTAFVQTIE